MNEVIVDDDDDNTAFALLRMSAYPIDPGFGSMRCVRTGAVWLIGAGPMGGSRRPPALKRDEFQATLEWESGDRSLVAGDLLTPDRPPTDYPTHTTELDTREACPSCSAMTPVRHDIRVCAGELQYRALWHCERCGREATVNTRLVPDEIETALRGRDGLIAIHVDLHDAALAAALSGAAEIDLSEARQRVTAARGGAPLFVGSSHAAEVVAQRLEIVGYAVVRRQKR